MYDIELTYCVPWNYLSKAVSLAEEILSEHAAVVRSFKFIPSDGGRFEFVANGELLFSKKQLKRHAQPEEVNQIFKKHLGQ